MSEGVHQKDTEGQKWFGHVKASPQRTRAVLREESAPPFTYHLDQKIEAEDEQNVECSQPRWALHMSDECGTKGLQVFSELQLLCQKEAHD